MDITQIATQHFDKLAEVELKSFEVPEWKDEKGKCVRVYYRNIMSYQVHAEILDKAAADFNACYIDIMMLRALNKDGTLMFSKANRHLYETNVAPNVIRFICENIMHDDPDIDVEIVEKK